MKHLGIAPFVVAGALAAFVSTSSHAQSTAGGQTAGHEPHAGGMSDMPQMMMGRMKEMQSMKMSGDTDRDFAMMMRHHHQSGVAMARREAEQGRDPTMRELAKRILASQEKEIAEFDRWLKEHPAK